MSDEQEEFLDDWADAILHALSEGDGEHTEALDRGLIRAICRAHAPYFPLGAGPQAGWRDKREVKLGVIEFHERFYAVRDDLTAAGCIVDLWLMDIATVLGEFGYEMHIVTDKPLPLPAPPGPAPQEKS